MPEHVFRWTEFAVDHGTRLAVIALIALLLNRVLRSATKRLVKIAGVDGTSRVARMRIEQAQTLSGVLYSAGTTLIVIIAVLMALPEFGFNVTPVAAAAGLASLALGFGAQHVVHDFINGFFAILEDQYVVGDTVRINDILGRVEHLTLRRTVLRDPQGAIITIPNGTITKVANLSRDYGQLFLDTTVAAEESPQPALKALESVAAGFRSDGAWLPMLMDGPRVLGVESLTPAGMTLRMQVRTLPNRQDDVARELRRRIQIELAERGIPTAGVQRLQLIGSASTSVSESAANREPMPEVPLTRLP